MRRSIGSCTIWITDVLRALVATMLLVLLPSAGCQLSSAGAARGAHRSDNGVWPFQPESIRVHPLTRLETTDDGAVLETWVQLLDGDGYPLRGLGLLTVRLENAGPGYMHRYEWTVELESTANTDVRFDPVASAYMLLLEVDPDTLPTRPRVYAALQTPSGNRLSGRLSLDEPDEGS